MAQKIIETLDINNKLHISNILDSYTGEQISYTQTSEINSDPQCDGVIYRKYKSTYIKRDFQGAINVKWFGAKGDGLNDDAPLINIAVATASLLKSGLFLPEGVYLLNSYIDSSSRAFIWVKSNIDVFGEGDSTILKCGNGLFADVFAPPTSLIADRVDNVSFRNFKIDCNGANNLRTQTGAIYNMKCISVRFGSNIIVDNVTMVENAGRQCLSFGANIKPQSITDLKITNNRIYTAGGSVSGNIYQNDHSMIYAQADGCIIENNRLVNPDTLAQIVCTGIECHSKNVTVRGNYLKNVSTGCNLVATVTDQVNATYSNNVFDGIYRGIMLWSTSGNLLQNVRIQNNYFNQISTDFGIIDTVTHNSYSMGSIYVEQNYFTNTSSSSGIGRGVTVGDVSYLSIKNNTFKELWGRAVSSEVAGVGNTLIIEDNTIEDIGRTTTSAHKYAIALVNISTANFSLLSIKGNKIKNISGTSISTGIYCNTAIIKGSIKSNEFVGMTLADITIPVATVITDLDIDYSGSMTTNPNARIKANTGSKWVNTSSGEVWYRRTTGLGSDWNLELYSDTLPSSGIFYKGDKVLNITPLDKGFIGYIATNSGGSPLWKKYGAINNDIDLLNRGTTALRPTPVNSPFVYYDTTLSRFVFWNGSAWVNSDPDATTSVRGLVLKAAAVTDIATADATDLPTAITLANANKAKMNALLASLRIAGLLT